MSDPDRLPRLSTTICLCVAYAGGMIWWNTSHDLILFLALVDGCPDLLRILMVLAALLTPLYLALQGLTRGERRQATVLAVLPLAALLSVFWPVFDVTYLQFRGVCLRCNETGDRAEFRKFMSSEARRFGEQGWEGYIEDYRRRNKPFYDEYKPRLRTMSAELLLRPKGHMNRYIWFD